MRNSLIILSLLLSLISNANADNSSSTVISGGIAQVIKNNGSIAHYPLLPLRLTPEHRALVQRRMMTAVNVPESAGAAPNLPDSYQIDPSLLSPVRDQGERAVCAFFADVAILEAYYVRQNPSLQSTIDISEECLIDVRDWEFNQKTAYTGADQPTALPDSAGDDPTQVVLTVEANGIPESMLYSNGVDCRYGSPKSDSLALNLYQQTITFDSIPYGKGLNFNINHFATIDSIRALIVQNIPVVVGINFYDHYQNSSDWILNPATDTPKTVDGGHAITITGYVTTNGKTVFTFKNSWGTDWGNNGYGTINDAAITDAWMQSTDNDFTISVQ